MKTLIIRLNVCAVLFISACTSNKEQTITLEKFPVANPIVMDTTYTNEYVADIHSIQNVEIRARVKGYIENIHADEGKPVKAGQLLFTINSREYKEALAKAKAMVKSALADAKAAEVDVQSIKTLLDKNIVSKTELEMAQSKLDAANAKIDEAKADEANAQLNLSYTEIRAPFDGILNRIPNKTGSVVDEGALLTSISNNKEVYVYFNVSEKEYLDYVSKKNSDKKSEASLILANNELHKQKGTVETVEGEFDKTTGNIAFRAKFPNPDGILRHGSSGKIRLTNTLKDAMLVPQKSTFEIQEKTYVFVVDKNNTVQMRNIVPKLRLPHLYVIESGLLPEDKLVYEGIQKIKEGDIIQPEFISPKKMLAQQPN
ncbi:MAG: efflux RND transporter periplasmic adaptor subunit [Bacteroidia bacterium]